MTRTIRQRVSCQRLPAKYNSLRLIAWNLSLAALGAATAAAIGEGYLQATKPFMTPTYAYVNVPGVGMLLKPGSIVRHTNKLDFWTTTRINRFGFADREPLPTSRTENSCHIAVIGDSFVEALEVPIAAKMHMHLERLAARELPHLDVTTSAYGRGGTAQVAQLPYYEKYAARLRPKLVVLVFSQNDFNGNSYGFPQYTSLKQTADGALRVRPPDPDWKDFNYPTRRRSFLAAWLNAKYRSFERQARWVPPTPRCLDCVRFALRRFAIGVQRDHAALVILSNYDIRDATGGTEWLRNAAGRIPVVSLADNLAARKRTRRDVRWDHDYHWNPTGHRWAASALLKYLRANETVCSAKAPPEPASTGAPSRECEGLPLAGRGPSAGECERLGTGRSARDAPAASNRQLYSPLSPTYMAGRRHDHRADP